MFIDRNERDCAHNNAFYAIALLFRSKYSLAREYMHPVFQLFNHPFLWKKSDSYFWSNCEDWRNKLYKLFGKDFYAGSNPDQIFPVLVYCDMTVNRSFFKKIIFGLILKLGFFGDNLQHVIFCPRIINLICKHYGFKLGYWFLDFIEFISYVPSTIKKETTNKIKLYLYLMLSEAYPTIWTYLLKKRVKKQYLKEGFGSFEQYFQIVFKTYFNQDDNKCIYDTMPYNKIREV